MKYISKIIFYHSLILSFLFLNLNFDVRSTEIGSKYTCLCCLTNYNDESERPEICQIFLKDDVASLKAWSLVNDINIKTQNGSSLLRRAVMYNAINCIEELLSLGLSPLIKNSVAATTEYNNTSAFDITIRGIEDCNKLISENRIYSELSRSKQQYEAREKKLKKTLRIKKQILEKFEKYLVAIGLTNDQIKQLVENVPPFYKVQS